MKIKYLFNHIFLFGLFLLILNDHLLKATYGNWWTGKLSDIAGILILPLFLKYLEICALPCEEPLTIPRPDSLGNCAFPIQYDVINGYDENIDSGENLNCF